MWLLFKEFRTMHVLWRAVLLFKFIINLHEQFINGYIWKCCNQLNRNIEPKQINQTGSFNNLVIALSGKNACLDGVITLSSSLTGSSTDLIQINDATIHPYNGMALQFYNKSSRTFYQAYIATTGMISILSPVPAGSYMINGSWIIK